MSYLKQYYRLFVEETSQYFPIHLYALKDKQPTFKELLNKIESIDKVSPNPKKREMYLFTFKM